jgi:predicted dehydrogenase
MSAARPPLRLGIVGCGRAAGLHARALRAHPDWRIAALADTDPEALAALAAIVRPERATPDVRGLATDLSLDAIAVCVPASAHAEVALGAIGAGRHVFVEKPLALALDDASRIAAAARSAGVRAMTGFNLRFHAQSRRAREAIGRGELGAIEMITSRLTSFHGPAPAWRAARASGGGVLYELATHHVDLWQWLTGATIDEVFARTRSGDREDETACLVARLSDGSLATAAFGERTSRRHDLDVFGRSGSVSMSFYRFDGFRSDATTGVAGDLRARWRSALGVAGALPRAVADLRAGGAWAASYRHQWDHFAAAIRGEAPIEVTLDDGVAALAVVLAAIESARTGRSVVVERR